jgi:hypothetical protein
MNAAQYQALFTNAFGDDPSAFGIEIAESGDHVVGTVGSHKVDLLVVKEKPICWMVDGTQLIDWNGVLTPKDLQRAKNGEALRAKIK